MLDRDIEILLIEDDQDDAIFLRRFLFRHPDFCHIKAFHHVESLSAACIFLEGHPVDLIFLDLTLPDSTGENTFLKIHQKFSGVPVIVLSGLNDTELSRALIQFGAQDYLIKGEITSDQLMRSIVYALKRHEADTKLRENEFRYRHVLSSISDYIWSAEVGADGKFSYKYCSPVIEKVTGRPVDFFMEGPHKWLSIIHPDDRARLQNMDWETDVKNADRAVEEYRIVLPDGKVKWVRDSVTCHKNVDGSTVLSGVVSDITERKQLDVFKDQFAGIVSHEIRTPLAIIGGAIENLADGLEGDINQGQRNLLQMAQKNVRRLQKIISDLLDLTRLESGRTRFYRQEIDFVGLLDEFAENVEKLVNHNRAIRLKVDVAKDTPKAWADVDCLFNVLNNLVSNAIRFAKNEVSITARASKSGVIVSVQDDGDGIAVEDQKLLFDKFVQLKRRADSSGYRGTGLGLAICKELVQAMNGRIWVESSPGQGSTFSFEIPEYVEPRDFFAKLNREMIDFSHQSRSFGVIAIGCCENEDPAEVKSKIQAFSRFLRKNILRDNDRLFFSSQEKKIIVLAMGERAGILSLAQRIVTAAADELQLKLETAVAMYPEDTDRIEDLLGQLRDLRNKPVIESKKKKVLFIDDEGDLIHVLVSRFVNQGFLVDVALNGEVGLEKVKSFCPDAIFLDVFMDKMDGWELCRRLREIPQAKKTPIIMLTAHQGDDFEARAKEIGADCLLQKPTSSKHLIEVLNKYLQ